MTQSQDGHNTGPQVGITVLDLTRFGAGPACSMILADMGADTIKLEPPGIGDPARTNAPRVQDLGGYFPYCNRNKRSITLDLQKPRGIWAFPPSGCSTSTK